MTPLVDLKKALDLDSLPGEDYVDTAAGLVIYSLKRIPKKSESITVAGYRFEVLDIDHHKIDQLLVSRLPGAAAPTAATAGDHLTGVPTQVRVMESPPSTRDAVPVTNDASSEARYNTARASSSGWPRA